MIDKEMQKALEADGEKLRQLTGEDHGPWVSVTEPCGHPDCEFPMCDCEVAPQSTPQVTASTPEGV